MQQRTFGSTGLRVSELGLGCARIGGIFKQDPASFVELLCAAHDHGINFFDTADMYSQGESERMIGRAFRSRRDHVIIASKVGYVLPAQRQLISRIKPLVRPLIRALGLKRENLPSSVRGELTQNFRADYVRSAVEASLRRLRTDYLDLLQLHSPSAELVRRGEWTEGLAALQKAGKVRHFGISCDTEEAALAALDVANVSSLQVVVNLLDRRFVDAVAAAKERGLAVIARECLANGLLIKAEQDVDLKAFCQSAEQEAQRREELASYRTAARERGVPLSRYAIDYVEGVSGVSVALVGVSSLSQLHATLRELT